MNFFYCDENLMHAAQALDDRRLTKMILETAQLLNNAMIFYKHPDAPYKPTHMNHPSSVWVRESSSNFHRMCAYFEHLFHEFEHRKGKRHKCEEHYHNFAQFPFDLQPDDWIKPYGTPVPNCTTHPSVTNVIEAYRLHLKDKWDKEFTEHRAGLNWYEPVWTKRGRPSWYLPPNTRQQLIDRIMKQDKLENAPTGA